MKPSLELNRRETLEAIEHMLKESQKLVNNIDLESRAGKRACTIHNKLVELMYIVSTELPFD